jgi:hypothetical protein
MSIESADNILHVKNSTMRISRVEVGQTLSVGNIEFENTTTLTSVTSNGNNTTPYTVSLSNATTGLVTTANVDVGGELTVSGNTTVTSNLEVGTANLYVDTTTGRVGVGTNTPMGTLDVKGVLNHTQTANVAQITSNSNVVMEYKLSTRDYETKEPRIALTANSDRGYVASASKEESTSRQAWKIFNNVQAEGDGWRSSTSDIEYNASGTYVGSSNLGTGAVNGEWVQIQLPYKIKLERFTLQPRLSTPIVPGSSPSLNYGRSEFIKNGKIYGSNDGVSWSLVHTITGISASTDTSIVSVIVDSSSAYYKYFGLVITDTNTSSASAAGTALSEWELYGTPFTANVPTGTDVVLHTTPNVPKTDFSNVYYDGQDYTSMPATVADKSGNGVTGTPSGGVGFDTTYKAFTFDGVDDKITATLTNPAGAWVHSTSMWFKVNSVSTANTLFSIKNNTVGETEQTPHLVIATGGERINHAFWGNDIYFGGYGGIVPNKWYHISTTYSGGSDAQSRKMFLNSVELGIDSTLTVGLLNVYANSTLRIGVYPNGDFPFNGSIANFRLYNQALSADEIWELYTYQKEYFGYGDLSMTLKAGRLGIGTSEPRAVLDVRGGLDVMEGLSCGGVLKIGTAGKDYGISQDQGNPHYGRKNLFIHSTFEGTATEDYGWWIGAQHQTLTSTDNDLYFIVVRNGVENAAAYVSDDTNQSSMNFTGQHRTFIKNVPFSQAGELEGLIVSSDQNKYIKMSGGIETGSNAITTNESLPVVSLSNVVSDKKCFGVISASEDPKQRSDAFGNFVTPYKKENGDTRVYINSVGEGAIWVVNTNGPLEAGDYITTSNVVGYGQKQDGAGLMNYTVAKITMDCDFNPVTQPIQIIEKGEDGKNVLDEHGQIQWEDHTTETEKAYKIRYIDASGAQTDEANAMYTAAFVGCTYHCG